MILFRALNSNDVKAYNDFNLDGIYCTLYYNINDFYDYSGLSEYKLKKNKKNIEKSQKYFNRYYKDALNSIIGHINSGKLIINCSPWISTSSDFRYVADEYAIPQASRYNCEDRRRPIILIDYNNNNIGSTIKQLKNANTRAIDENNLYEFGIDLRNGNLDKFYKAGAIDCEGEKIALPLLDENGNFIRNENNEIMFSDEVKDVTGLSNFASSANEVLIYRNIPRKNIKLVLYPFLQDLIYFCNIDIANSYNYIIQNEKVIKNVFEQFKDVPFFSDMYPSYEEGNSLTDTVIKRKYMLYFDTLEKKYNYLKTVKKIILNRVACCLNDKLNTNFFGVNPSSKIVDDRVYVSDLNNENNYNPKDIILVEDNNHIYKYDHSVSGYVSVTNGKVLEETIKYKKNNNSKKIGKK